MVALSITISPFGEFGGSNLKIKSYGKLGDNEDIEKELCKEPKKE
jgi:hypothetical protein